MRLFGPLRKGAEANLGEAAPGAEPAADGRLESSDVPEGIPGERGPASVHRVRSLQSRVVSGDLITG